MNRVIGYKVVAGTLGGNPSSSKPEKFQQLVQEAIDEGWQPYGSAFCAVVIAAGSPLPATPQPLLYQPMVKYK